MSRTALLATTAALDVAVLLCGRPRFGELARGLGAPHAWLRDAGTDHVLVALASAAIWCAAVWLACALVALAATVLPGNAGRLALLASRRLLPGTLRRLLAGSAGLSILIAPVAAGAATHVGHGPPGSVAGALPTPTWPVDPPASSLPVPQWPGTPSSDPPAQRRRETIRVRAGDSLWAIAARRLGPAATREQIAREWPRWYAANRSQIGADPDLIQPGDVLRAPKDNS